MFIPVERRTALRLAAAVLIGGSVAALWNGHARAQQAPGMPMVKVKAAESRLVSDWVEYSGRLEAIEHVEIRPRVAGTLLAVHFQDGQQVRQGDLLFTIDPAPFEAELRRVQAMLAQAQDRQRFTASELERGRRLLAANAIAKRDFDALDVAAREANSAVQAARAAVERARLDVDYTRIRAPIAGRISRPEITAGNVVKAGGDAAPLASIVTTDPIYAAFNIDERTYMRAIGGRDGKTSLQVRVGLAGEDGHPHEGRLHSVDNQLDTRSGTIRTRAIMHNPDGRMIPGLQARVRLQVGAPFEAVVVDEASISIDQDRRFVLIVGQDGRVQYRQLELGSRQGMQRVVRRGLAAGDQVIVEGANRVRPGDAVQAVPVPAMESGGEQTR